MHALFLGSCKKQKTVNLQHMVQIWTMWKAEVISCLSLDTSSTAYQEIIYSVPLDEETFFVYLSDHRMADHIHLFLQQENLWSQIHWLIIFLPSPFRTQETLLDFSSVIFALTLIYLCLCWAYLYLIKTYLWKRHAVSIQRH